MVEGTVLWNVTVFGLVDLFPADLLQLFMQVCRSL